MGVYLCQSVSEQLQDIKGIVVRDKGGEHWTFRYKDAQASMRILPGCCGVLLAYRISGKDSNALKLLRAIVAAARKANFGAVLVSLLTNSPLRKALGEDWVSTGFINPRTRNNVDILVYKIPVKLKEKKVTVHEDN